MDKILILALVLIAAVVGTFSNIDNITARDYSVETINYHASMPIDLIHISPGDTIMVPATIFSDTTVPLRLKMAVTYQGDEINHMLGGPTKTSMLDMQADIRGDEFNRHSTYIKDISQVTASISQDSINLKVNKPNTVSEHKVNVTISASEYAEPGEYPFSFVLHHKRDGPDVNSVTYFYVIVE